MSVVKSKRGKSKVEFEMNYFRLADGIDNLVENYFFAEHDTIQQHKLFIKSRAEALVIQANRELDPEDLKYIV